jgi:hypothetical protein
MDKLERAGFSWVGLDQVGLVRAGFNQGQIGSDQISFLGWIRSSQVGSSGLVRSAAVNLVPRGQEGSRTARLVLVGLGRVGCWAGSVGWSGLVGIGSACFGSERHG